MVLLSKSEFQGLLPDCMGYTDGDTQVTGLSEFLMQELHGLWSY